MLVKRASAYHIKMYRYIILEQSIYLASHISQSQRNAVFLFVSFNICAQITWIRHKYPPNSYHYQPSNLLTSVNIRFTTAKNYSGGSLFTRAIRLYSWGVLWSQVLLFTSHGCIQVANKELWLSDRVIKVSANEERRYICNVLFFGLILVETLITWSERKHNSLTIRQSMWV